MDMTLQVNGVEHELAVEPRHTLLALTDDELRTVTELFCDRRYPLPTAESGKLRIEPYGYRWLRVGGAY